MVDQPDPFHPEPTGNASSDDVFPQDFFDSVEHASEGETPIGDIDLNLSETHMEEAAPVLEPELEPDPEPELVLSSESAAEKPAPAIHEMSSFKHPVGSKRGAKTPAPVDEEPKDSRAFPVVVGGLMLATLFSAWAMNTGPKPEPPPAAPAPAPAESHTPPVLALAATGEPPAAEADSRPAPAPAPSPDLSALKSEIEAFAAKIKGIEEKLTELLTKPEPAPRPEPAAPEPAPVAMPDLKPLQGKLDELAKSVSSVTPLIEKVEAFEKRFEGVNDRLASLKDDLGGLADDLKKLATASPAPAAAAPSPSPAPATTATTEEPAPKPSEPSEPAPAATTSNTPAPAPAANTAPGLPTPSTPNPSQVADDSAAITQAVSLFKAGQYREADQLFKTLRNAKSQDARVYYYGALANALTTNDWQNESVKIATRGSELEKSGAAKSADIDAAFADLASTLKPWLAYYRSLAK